jgi:DMSO reductase family type II enzyme chaperone
MAERDDERRSARVDDAVLPIDSSDPTVVASAARSGGYALLAAGIEYPYPDRLAALGGGAWAENLRAAVAAHPRSDLCQAFDPDAVARPEADGETLQVEYTRLFDVGGPGGPPCPLYGGTYGGDRMKTMEEVVRFYRYFGLRPDEEMREPPDHLATELEFLHFLTYRETQSLLSGDDPAPLRRAEKDFLERHPGRWVPKLLARLDRQEPHRFYGALFRGLGLFLLAEDAYLRDILRPDESSAG